MDEFNIFIWLFICGFPALILWIIMLRIMASKGESVCYAIVKPSQYIRFWRIIKAESNRSKKRKYQIIFWAQVLLILLYPIVVFF